MADQLITGTTLIEDKRSGSNLVLSLNGSAFITDNEASNTTVRAQAFVQAGGNGISFRANVNLPDGATITSVIVYGSVTDETWTLDRNTNGTTTTSVMATANLDTEDTTISNAKIDNENFSYSINTSSLDAGDQLQGAVIKFTI